MPNLFDDIEKGYIVVDSGNIDICSYENGRKKFVKSFKPFMTGSIDDIVNDENWRRLIIKDSRIAVLKVLKKDSNTFEILQELEKAYAICSQVDQEAGHLNKRAIRFKERSYEEVMLSRDFNLAVESLGILNSEEKEHFLFEGLKLNNLETPKDSCFIPINILNEKKADTK